VDPFKPILPLEFSTREKIEWNQRILALRCLRFIRRFSGRRVDW
jgi:hypothetical protein